MRGVVTNSDRRSMLMGLRHGRLLQNTMAAMTVFRGGITHMAEPIANDWKAIRDRMQQIKAEESAFPRPCPQGSVRPRAKIAEISNIPTIAAALRS